MLLSLLLSLMRAHERPHYSWTPDLDLSDHAIYVTLLPGAYN